MARQRHIQHALGHTAPVRPADWLCMISVCSGTTAIAVAGSESPFLSTDSMIHRGRQHSSPALGGSSWQQPFPDCTFDTATHRLATSYACHMLPSVQRRAHGTSCVDRSERASVKSSDNNIRTLYYYYSICLVAEKGLAKA